jgi:flagellar hook-associated protein 3 FlgL
MRVTNRMMVQNVVQNLQRNVASLDRVQQQVSSSKRVTRPADDPTAAALGVRIRSQRAAQDQYLRNVDQARTWLSASDIALGDAGESLGRIRELLVQAANDTYTAADRFQIGREIQSLRDHLIATFNSTLDGETYLFSGTATTTAPFALATAGSNTVTFHGNQVPIAREVGPGTQMDLNVDGKQFEDLFYHLELVLDMLPDPALGAVDAAAQRSQINGAIQQLDDGIDLVLVNRGHVGAKINRLDFTEARMQTLEVETSRLQSNNEDLDFAEALTRLTTQQAVYRAALEAGARTAPMSLFDFLG